MYTIYGIPNCNTIKKTLDFFKDNGLAYAFHDYKKKGLNKDKFAEWLQQKPLELLVNKKGTTYKTLSDSQKIDIFDPNKCTDIILQNTSILKRPIIEHQKIVCVGFDIDVFQK